MTSGAEHGAGDPRSEFRGRLDRRLSYVFGSLFILVVLTGGASLYLLGSLLLRSDTIARESEQVHLVEQARGTLQRMLSGIQQAHLEHRTLSDSERPAYSTQLKSLLAQYSLAGGAARSTQELRDIVTAALWVADRIAPPSSPVPVDGREIALLEDLEQRARMLADRVSAEHRATEQRHVQQTYRTLRLTIGINVAFVVVGTMLLLASHRYFHRAIASPLRQLAERASDIARGEPYQPIAVSTSDEIGRLSHAFNRMVRRLEDYEDRLKRLVTVEERQRLARELHDSLAQDLALLRLKLIEADRGIEPITSAGRAPALHDVLPILDSAYRHLREAILGLRALDGRAADGLVETLEEYLRDFCALGNLPVELRVPDGVTLGLPRESESQLIRIIHEALANVVRHADASKATVKMEHDRDALLITIEDDGKGFVLATTARPDLHFGLQTMRERAEAVGGALEVQSTPGQGAGASPRRNPALPAANPRAGCRGRGAVPTLRYTLSGSMCPARPRRLSKR